MQLSIRRNKGVFNKFHPKYILVATFIDSDGRKVDKEIMVAKKRSGNKTSNYMFSFDINNPKPSGPMYVAKLRATDSKKNEYYLYDSGENPNETEDENQWRITLMGIYFGSSKMHSIGNIRTTNLSMFKLEDELDPDEGEINKIRLQNNTEISKHPYAISVIDKRPKWSTAKNKYVYNFAGR